MGAAGPAILFVTLLAASTVVGIFVLAFAARCVLVIVQETGLGQDEIVWPSEPYVDWLGHAVQFVELIGIWLAPAALAARLLRHVWLPDDAALRVVLLAGPGLWLFFPIGLLSSLSAQSRWVPFRWAIFVRFLRVIPSTVLFYFLSGILLAAGVAPWYYALFGGKSFLLPVAAVMSAVIVFLYARLLGRLAWVLQRLPATERKPARASVPKRSPVSKPQARKKRPGKTDVHDPWAVPEEEAEHQNRKRFPWAQEPAPKPKPEVHPPSAEEIERYGFAADRPVEPEPSPKQPSPSRAVKSPGVYRPKEPQDAPVPAGQPPLESQAELFAEQVRQRLAERTRHQPVAPAHPFFSGVYSFPLYGVCLPHMLALFLGVLTAGGLVYQLLQIGRDLFGW